MTDKTTVYPTDAMHEIANKHSRKCLAAFGREVIKGAAGWTCGRDPQDLVREAIINALCELGDQHEQE